MEVSLQNTLPTCYLVKVIEGNSINSVIATIPPLLESDSIISLEKKKILKSHFFFLRFNLH